MQKKQTTRMRVSLVIALFCLLLASTQARGQAVAGYSEYILPGDELNMYYIFNNLDANAGSTAMHSVTSVTAWSPNTTVYYDHWENGYNFDPNNPGATADETYTLTSAGQVLVFESATVPSGGPPPNPRSAATTTCPGQLNPLGASNGDRCYDGGDRIYVAGGAVTVTRATWIDAIGAGNQADAWEIYPVKPQLTTYVMGFGEDLYATSATYFTGFQRVYALIQATADNTTVTVDLNHDGTPDVLNQNRGATWNTAGPGTIQVTQLSTAVVGTGSTFLTSVYPGQPIIIPSVAGVEYVVASVTDNTHLTLTSSYAGANASGLTYIAGEGSTIYLNKGQTFLLDNISACPSHVTCTTAPGTLNTGAVITGNKTLQVKYVTGDTGTRYTARGASAFPRGYWSNQYYAPFGEATSGNGHTDYYLFNPNSAALTVNWQGTTTSGSFSIPANSTQSFNQAQTPPAIPSVPVGSGLYFSASSPFWGVGFGDCTAGAYEWAYSLLPTEFLFREHYLGWSPGSYPLMSAPINGDSVFVTVAQDNTRVFVDYNNDGVADLTYTLNRLQSQFVPPNPTTGALTGARFWATGPFTMAYGENPDTANTSSPSLDLGYVALPATDFVSLVLTVTKSANPAVVSTASGSYTDFTIKADSQAYSVDGVYVVDTLPPSWQYTPGHTTITKPDLTTSNADPTITGAGTAANPYVLTWSAAQTGGNMAPNQEISITFRAQTTAVLATGTLSQNNVVATGTRTVGSGPAVTQTFTATDFAFVTSGSIGITKTSNAGTPAYPGDTFTYTTTVTNPAAAGTNLLTGVSLYDPIPTGLTDISGTTSISQSTVADSFSTAAYTNNDGTNSWAGNWTETDTGTGAAGATGGYVWITNGQLQFRDVAAATPTVIDNFTTNGVYTGSNGTVAWNAAWTETDAYGTGPAGAGAGAAGGYAWVTGNQLQFQYLLSTVADNFDAASFTGNDGSNNWLAAWTENDAGGAGAAAGYVQAYNDRTGSISAVFRNITGGNAAVGSYLARAANLTGATTATLSLVFNRQGATAADTVVVQASAGGVNGTYTTVLTLTGTSTRQTYTADLTPYISATTAIKLIITTGFVAGNGTLRMNFDNVTISYNSPLSASATAVQRSANLTTFTSPELTFTYSPAGLTSSDTVVVQASSTGIAGTFTTLATFTGGVPNVAPPYDLTPYSSTTTTIRFAITGGFATAGQTFSIGGVTINAYGTPAGTLIYRTANLTGASAASLGFTYSSTNLTSSDTLVVEACITAGGTYTTLATFTGGVPSVGPSYTLSPYISATTTIRFRVTGGFTIASKTFSVDNLSIMYNVPFTATALDPPELMPASYLYFLGGGQSITTTFNVTVNDPFPTGQTSVTNTAAVTSTQTPIPITASVTNTVANPASQSATVAGTIWFDANGNGTHDVGEPGIANVQVTLKDQYGTPIATMLTDSNGRYLFTGVTPGTGYYVQATAPPDPAGEPLTNLTQSFPVGYSNYRTTTFNLIAGQNYTGADEGYKPASGTVSFGDLVWVDPNANGVRDAGEVSLGGVTLRLYRDANSNNTLEPLTDTFVAVPTTGAGVIAVTNGSMAVVGTSTSFTSLGAGDSIVIGGVSYTIASVTDGTHLNLTATYAGTTATGLEYTVLSAAGVGTVAATLGSAGVVGTGTAFTSLAPGDPIDINGVKYKVSSVTDATHLTLTANYTGTTATGLTYGLAVPTVSGPDGSYLFSGVTPVGVTYFVTATTPAGYTATTATTFRFLNVASGTAYLTADFGFNSGSTHTITDRVWRDLNANGLFDNGEVGIAGVTVALLDSSDNVIATTATNSSGLFTFSGLTAGNYTTKITDTAGVLASYYGTTSYALADQRTETISSANIDRSATPSYGYNVTRAIGTTVYDDINGDGSQNGSEPGMAGIVVSLYQDLNADGLIDLATRPGLGTVSVTAGSAAVVGTGTTFTNYHVGDTITINNGGANYVAYTILTIADDTHLTLTATYAGATNAARAYYGSAQGPGTLAVTNGSAAVVGTGTVFTNYHVGDTITINNGGATYVTYTILTITDATHLTLTANYAGTTNAARAYDGPPLSPGTVAVTNGSAAVVGTGTNFTTYHAGDTITISNGGANYVQYTVASVTDATHLTLTGNYAGTTNAARTYSYAAPVGAGTVAVTNGSATVTGTGTAFLNYHAGEPIVIGGVEYIIQSVASATSLTLTANYTGTTAAALAYYGPAASPGTVTTTAGSPAVVGTGTTFTNYAPGQPITINGAVYTIASVTDNTHLTLTTNAVANTNVAYYGSSGPIATVTTDSNGQYLFPGLANGSYIVSVQTPTGYNYIPGTRTDTNPNVPGIQLASTISGTANDFTRNFGFQAQTPRTISGTIWNDPNFNGVIDAGESGLASVTVSLLGTAAGPGTVSVTSGTAAVTGVGTSFTNLSAGQTITIGTVAYSILSITDPTHLTLATNASATSSGVAYNVGGSTVATTTTAGDGTYSFTGLASAVYVVKVTDTAGVLNGYSATAQPPGGTSGPFTGQAIANASAGNVANINFGYEKPGPTYASLDTFTAFVSNRTVTVQWRTSSEIGTVGFHLLRWDPAAGSFRQLDDGLLPGLLVHPEGGVYRYRDDDAPLQGSLTYKLVEVDFQGREREHGPFTVAPSTQAEPETESAEAEAAPWPDDVVFQRRPNEIAKEQQERMLVATAEQLTTAEAVAGTTGGTGKITTNGDGLYYVSAGQAGTALGISNYAAAALIAKGQVDLTSLGAEVAYLPATSGSGFYFYAGQPQTIYSAQTSYLLTASRGKTMGNASKGNRGPAATSFAQTLHREENHYALPVFFTDPDGDFWCWDYVIAGTSSDTKSFTMPVRDVAGTGAASLTVRLHGGSDTAAPLDHHAVITWNGTQVGEARWDGTTTHDLTIPLGAAAVQEGDNTLELQGVLDSGVPYSIVYLDYFELTYQRLFRADGNELTFTAPTSSTITVGGFSSPDILVLDLGSSSAQPSVVTPTVTAATDGTYQAQFVTPSGRAPRSYLASVRGQAMTPAGVAAMQLAGLKSLSNGADYVLIAPDSLLTATGSLAAYRSAQGLKTMVVALKDIYNEFGYGNASPYAIRAFLSYAVSNWHKAPRYALLVGRGTYDYTDYMGVGDCLVPPLMTATPYGLFVSDNRIADLSGNNGVPEIALGRLPVLTSQDVTNYLTKIQAHEQASNPRRVLMVADNPDAAGSFNADSDAVAKIVPSTYAVAKVYLPAYTPADAEQAIINAINNGVAIFNYIGHGGAVQLADEKIFQPADVAALTNATVMPIFLGMTCTAGSFGFPGHPSLAETMLLKQGGGVYASWASSGLSEDGESVLLNKAFFTTAFTKSARVVGDVIVSSLRSSSAATVPPSMRDLYNLLGEPVSRFP